MERELFSGPHVQRLRRRVTNILGETGPPGAAVALIVDGEAWSEGVGFRDLARTEPLTTDALLPIYSVTKILISSSVMKLVERRVIALDQPVGAVLPGVPLPAEVTIRHLLNHTSGLADYGAMPEYRADLRRDPAAPWSEQEFVDRVLARGMQFAPGEGWGYANVGYLLLRQVLERTSDQSLPDVLAKDTFRPLGLRQARVVTNLTETGGLAPGYSTVFTGTGAREDVVPRYHPGWVSHGLVAATAPEVATFLDQLLTGHLVASGLVSDMVQGVTVPGDHPRFRRPGYGLGLMVDPASPFGQVAGHGGGGPGYSAGAFHFANVGGRRVTSVALVNGDERDWGEEIAFALADEVAAMAGGSR